VCLLRGTDWSFKCNSGRSALLHTHLLQHAAVIRRTQGEAWEPSKKQCCLAHPRALDRKVPSLIMQSAKLSKTIRSLLFSTNYLVVNREPKQAAAVSKTVFLSSSSRGACVTQIVATRICRPVDNKPCDGHPQTVPLGQN